MMRPQICGHTYLILPFLIKLHGKRRVAEVTMVQTRH